MRYGEQKIDGKWYYFDKNSGAMAKGFTKLGPRTVYYGDDGAIDPAQPFPLEADHIHPSPEPSQKDPEQSWCGNASHGYASRTLRRTPGAPGVDR